MNADDLGKLLGALMYAVCKLFYVFITGWAALIIIGWM